MARDEELFIEQIAKTKAERTKCELEAKEIQDRLTTPWYRRAHFVQAIAAGLVALPIIWFYVEKVAIPLSQAENHSIKRENEENKYDNNKIKRENEENRKEIERIRVENERLLNEQRAENERLLKITKAGDIEIVVNDLINLQQQYKELSEKYDKLADQSAMNQKEKDNYLELARRTSTRAEALNANIKQAELRIETTGKTLPKGGGSTHGFIWIGNYDSVGKRWTTTRLNGIENLEPKDIQTNKTYAVSGDMTLRAQMPKDDTDYFRGVESIGYVPKGTPVKILDLPERFDRETKIQYWVEVEAERTK